MSETRTKVYEVCPLAPMLGVTNSRVEKASKTVGGWLGVPIANAIDEKLFFHALIKPKPIDQCRQSHCTSLEMPQLHQLRTWLTTDQGQLSSVLLAWNHHSKSLWNTNCTRSSALSVCANFALWKIEIEKNPKLAHLPAWDWVHHALKISRCAQQGMDSPLACLLQSQWVFDIFYHSYMSEST